MKNCYSDQYCPMAHALRLVGERWSLLIVRELLHGPKRYTDLTKGLPGIGTNILAARLRDLETAGVLTKRKLPPPYASTVYELTPYGRELDEVLFALGRWGARSLGPPSDEEELYPEWGLNALPALFDHDSARGLTATWVLTIGPDTFTAHVEDGRLEASVGAVEYADLVLQTDTETFFALTAGQLEPADALSQGRVTIEGEADELPVVFEVLHLAPRGLAV
jgi:DNA-binding HxlR family transcriptional regulator